MPTGCLDVLAQQVVACVAMDRWEAPALFDLVRGAYPYRDLPASAFEGVLEMVSGRFAAETIRDLRPRISWDRLQNRLHPLPGTAQLALVAGGTIPETGQDRITVVVGPEQFTATLATWLPQVLHHATGETDWGHGVFVAIPTRAKLLYRVVDGSDAIGSLIRLFHQAQQAFDSEPGPVSPHVYWVHGDRWQQATGPDSSGAPSILVREQLEAEFERAGWV